MNLTVLGAGLVGSAIIKDLAKNTDFQLTAVDLNPDLLGQLAQALPLKTVQANLQTMPDLSPLLAGSDLVICAVPGFMGFETVKKIIQAGKNLVDISFFSEDPFALDALAKRQNVTAVVDCGVAPGLSNIIAGYVETQLDELHSYTCYVGGLPQTRRWPYEYRAVFSPIDVLEEYTRPAQLVEYGQKVTRPALSEVELIDFPQVGTLEAFNTDGLRSLAKTLKAPFMKEKTLRYPGHANLMRVFRESGFFSPTAIPLRGQEVVPLDLTAKLLFDHWKMAPDEADLTLMQIIIEGRLAGQSYRYTYDLLDRYDVASQTTAMARTTGYTCTITAQQLLQGMFSQPGICPPEWLGRTPGCFENLLAEYRHRNIHLTETIVAVNCDSCPA